MKHARGRRLAEVSLALVAASACLATGQGQTSNDTPAQPGAVAATLELPSSAAAQIQHAVDTHDYLTAEKLLLAEIARDPKSPHAAQLLAYTGNVYFLNQDYMGAAIAWKKSQAIAPLDPKLRFSLAMAYIRLNHSDWARNELESLAKLDGKDALLPYWLGRMDYDGHEYNGAIRHFQKAIELDRSTEHPSPWPFLNLAITEQFLGQAQDAETNLREALRLDPEFTKAHFQLGTVLEDEGRLKEALVELREAARLDATYPEPHMAMARINHKLGNETEARDEVQAYLRLRPHATPQ